MYRHEVENPVGQRSFEKLKPWIVKQMKEKDRLTCGCSLHENARFALCAVAEMSRRVHSTKYGGKCIDPNAPCNRRATFPSSVHGFFEQVNEQPQVLLKSRNE